MKAFAGLCIAAMVAACLISTAVTRADTSTRAKSPAHPRLLPFLHRPKATGIPTNKSGTEGRIIGNRRTHVYHMPGDRGALPADKNHVYFATEAKAVAAGYRRAYHRGAHAAASNGHHPRHGKKPAVH